MMIKTVLSLLSLAAASGIAVTHHTTSDKTDKTDKTVSCTTPVVDDLADACRVPPVAATTEARFEQTLDQHAALTTAIIKDARDRALRLEETGEQAASIGAVGVSSGTFASQPFQDLRDRTSSARFEFKPKPTGRRSAKHKKPKPQYIKPGGGGSRYSRYGSRRERMFQRSRQYDVVRKKNRDRDRIGRLRTGISRVTAPRRDYVKRQSKFRNSRWGLHADSRYRYRAHTTNKNLSRAKQRQVRRRR
jgi:hypothetical protein